MKNNTKLINTMGKALATLYTRETGLPASYNAKLGRVTIKHPNGIKATLSINEDLQRFVCATIWSAVNDTINERAKQNKLDETPTIRANIDIVGNA